MITLLIIADDFTGALDTGVQFAAAGAGVRVVTDIRYDYRKSQPGGREAYEVVWNITKRAMACGVPFIYKKTDSALRGNIGSELTALLDASGQDSLPFIPAFPQMGRITREGVHYINNIPVKDSVFGRDPFEPVTCSFIPDIIHQQSNIQVEVMREEDDKRGMDRMETAREPNRGQQSKIVVYDAQSQESLITAASDLYRKGCLSIMAGCAGFASVLPKLLGLEGGESHVPEFISRFLVVCGSVNPITKSQLDYAQAHGFTRIRLTPRQKLDRGYWWMLRCQIESRCILDSNDPDGTDETLEYARKKGISLEEVRTRIADAMGFVLGNMVERGLNSTLLITGGDTLMGFMNQIKVCEMEPVCEMAPGTVLSRFRISDHMYQAISKSGGFGSEDLLVQLADTILDKKERALC